MKRSASFHCWRGLAGSLLVAAANLLVPAGPADAAGRNGRNAIHVRLDTAMLRADDAQGRSLAGILVDQITSELFREFGCTWVSQASDIEVALGFVRQQQLLATPGVEDFNPANLAAKPKHLVNITAMPMARGINVSLVSADTRLSRGEARLSGTMTSIADGKALAERFAERMARLEICPYTGPVKFTINTWRSQTELDDHAVYCNGQDQRYRRKLLREAGTAQSWTLRKIDRPDTTGEIDLVNTEREEETVEDGCHRCNSGRQAGRTSSSVTIHDTRLHALSQTGRIPGAAYKDATVTMYFEDGDQVWLGVKAVSDRGARKTEVTQGAQGSCDSQPPTTRRRELATTVSIEELRVGPFPGKSTDKHLQGRVEVPINDPLTGETGTKTVEFDLRRD